MEYSKTDEKSVKEANKKFYDAVADSYENIDGRRSNKLEMWLRTNLSNIRKKVHGGYLLDIGTGSGFVTRCAEGLFTERIGVDISPKILAANRKSFDLGVCADVDRLPFVDNTFDVITCFSVLHHLYNFEKLIFEIARVIKPGGIFYSDHDIDINFSKRFKWPLRLYRRFYNASSKYIRANKGVTEELYNLSEYHGNGVDSDYLIRMFEKSGFTMETGFHWFGLNPVTDVIFGQKSYLCGRAPLFSMVAYKKT